MISRVKISIILNLIWGSCALALIALPISLADSNVQQKEGFGNSYYCDVTFVGIPSIRVNIIQNIGVSNIQCNFELYQYEENDTYSDLKDKILSSDKADYFIISNNATKINNMVDGILYSGASFKGKIIFYDRCDIGTYKQLNTDSIFFICNPYTGAKLVKAAIEYSFGRFFDVHENYFDSVSIINDIKDIYRYDIGITGIEYQNHKAIVIDNTNDENKISGVCRAISSSNHASGRAESIIITSSKRIFDACGHILIGINKESSGFKIASIIVNDIKFNNFGDNGYNHIMSNVKVYIKLGRIINMVKLNGSNIFALPSADLIKLNLIGLH